MSRAGPYTSTYPCSMNTVKPQSLFWIGLLKPFGITMRQKRVSSANADLIPTKASIQVKDKKAWIMRAPSTPQHKEMQPSALLAFHQLQRVYFAAVAPHVEGSTLSIIVLYCTRTNFPTRQISTVLFLFETPGLRSFPQSTANPLQPALKQTCIIFCSILILFACLALCVWSGWSLSTMLCAHWIMLHRVQTPLWGTVLDAWINGRL